MRSSFAPATLSTPSLADGAGGAVALAVGSTAAAAGSTAAVSWKPRAARWESFNSCAVSSGGAHLTAGGERGAGLAQLLEALREQAACRDSRGQRTPRRAA